MLELRANALTVSSALLLAGAVFSTSFGAYELARPDTACIEHDAAGACIQTQSPNTDDRILSGVLVGFGVLSLVAGIATALSADHYFQELARARSGSVAWLPWAAFDSRGGAAGVVLRW